MNDENKEIKENKNLKDEFEETTAEKVKDAALTVGEKLFSFVVLIVIIYFTMINSGWLSDTITSNKYSNPSEYFKGSTTISMAFKYQGKLFVKLPTVEITVNGISVGTLSEGEEKIIQLNLNPNETYRIRFKDGWVCKDKVKFTPTDNNTGYYFTFDGGELTNNTYITSY